ncbi:hypothetical protein FFLO_05231 [Filobasidium floriforme]|uniref:Uncharacterized protein n=1 Tax=Filobasidium floriforme TaxID=5210 RepID=A0A8K0NNF5_9TREE|nr:uncharacterized protein HD553DRAFT_322744 [Filobasidium floriforme]KAG7530183.1 hypothetical protein FFLO_05231 [Filobasidium floriforme]KAH8087235.1 hypothetical protein HD553DRAFT_322744 [Filobasidium floriforme]
MSDDRRRYSAVELGETGGIGFLFLSLGHKKAALSFDRVGRAVTTQLLSKNGTKAEPVKPPAMDVVKISGTDIDRGGVEAFVLIDLEVWKRHDVDNFPVLKRDKLIRDIVRNVWKSFTASSHQISTFETCMVFPDTISTYYRNVTTKRADDWKPPVDVVLQGSDGFFSSWSRKCLPRKRPIIVAHVKDTEWSCQKDIDNILLDCNVLALHELVYPMVDHVDLIESMYGRDPEGTIKTKKEPEPAEAPEKSL